MILDQIVEDKKKHLPIQKKIISESQMRNLAEQAMKNQQEMPHGSCSFYENLKKPGLSIIGEFKKASPSLGKISSKIDLMERIDEYNASVDASSCLTE